MLEAIAQGPERVEAAAVLMTRASDADTALKQLLTPLGVRGVADWRRLLGWYADVRFTNSTGGVGWKEVGKRGRQCW